VDHNIREWSSKLSFFPSDRQAIQELFVMGKTRAAAVGMIVTS
jgi:hypothetical protein